MTARIWCGTYEKYNNGNLDGQWFELEKYSSNEELYQAFQDYHGPGDHEFLFNDYEGFPKAFYGESHIDPAIWDWLELDEDDQELLAVYQDNVDGDADIDRARDAFSGKFDSEEDWAEQFWDDAGMLSEVPAFARNYIDFAQYAKDCRLGGDMTFVRHDGEVWAFNNNI